MIVCFHPEFSEDVRRFRCQYSDVSERLGVRFQAEVDAAVARIKEAPKSAGHFLQVPSEVVRDVRRRNLPSFPFFVLYGLHGDMLIFGSVIPARTDPLTWLKRFEH
jgi:hypothetical protein